MSRSSIVAAVAAAVLFTAAGGFGAAYALGAGSAPARTVTVDVGTGATGPQGPPGPPGPKGDTGPAGLECPANFSAGELVLNAPGGQTRLWTCLHD